MVMFVVVCHEMVTGAGVFVTFPVDVLEAGESVTVTGKVFRIEETEDYKILYLKKSIISDGTQSIQERYFLVYAKGEKTFALGNQIKASGSLEFFENERNPGAFSRKKYYRTQRIAACIWTEEAEITDAEVYPVRERLRLLRKRWISDVLTVLGERKGGILNAMMLGDKQQMDAEVKERYQLNGIAHILAISGLHLSFVGLGFYRFVRRTSGSYLAGGLVGITFLLLYITMIGCTISAVRAVIMFGMQVGADMTGRVNDRLTAYTLAMAGVIWWRPLAFFDAGFQLSFGAVGAVLFLYPMIAPGKNGTRQSSSKQGDSGREMLGAKFGKLAESLEVSLCIELITVPVILYHYYELPTWSVFLNLIVIPLMSLVLLLGFTGSIGFIILRPAGIGMLHGCGYILDFFEWLCKVMEQIPGRRLTTGRPGLAGIILYYAILVLVVFWYHKQKEVCEEAKNVRFMLGTGLRIILLTAGIFTLMINCPAFRHKGLEITFLDVGQGDCAFVRTEDGRTCLIDGGSSDTKKVGRYQIEPFLKCRGVGRLDYMFVSHGDMDHINGLEELIERQQEGVSIGCVVLPEQKLWDEKLEQLCELATSNGIPVVTIQKGQEIPWKDVMLTCLEPDAEEFDKTGSGASGNVESGNGASESSVSGNAASMVLELQYGDLKVLFTGDVEGTGEEILTEDMTENCTVLKVAHHGSRNSTSEAFLKKAGPKLAIISAGRENRYGHPHAETLERLTAEGCSILNTAECGAITLRQTGKEVANLQIIQYNRFYEKFE